MPLLRVSNLQKHYGNTHAVRGLTFELERGRCVGLLGPNGAGKTTTLRMLSGLLKPTGGSIDVSGMTEGGDIRQRIGYLPQHPAFYSWMKGIEFLVYAGELAGVSAQEARKRADGLLELVGLSDAGKRRIGGYSGGMKQRLGIAQAMIHKPDLLILDEPVSALDPLGRREVLEMMRELKKETTILFSTHVLHDAEEISDDILIIRHGEIAVAGELGAVRKANQEPVIHIQADGSLEAFLEDWRQLPSVHELEFHGEAVKVIAYDLEQAKRALLSYIVENNISLLKFEVGSTSLEDLFMKVVKP